MKNDVPPAASAKPKTKRTAGEQKKTKDNEPKRQGSNWVLKVLIITLLLSFSISFVIELVYMAISVSVLKIIIAVILVMIIIAVSILADMLGVAATACDEQPFRSMASRKIIGAKKAIVLCQNADRVSSILNDIVGDVCGIISGASGATISAVIIANYYPNVEVAYTILISAAVSALIAAITITGKAIGKKTALTKSHDMIFALAKMLSIFDKDK